MTGKKCFEIIVIPIVCIHFSIFAISVKAQENPHCNIYRAFKHKNQALWKQTIELYQQEYNNHKSAYLLSELVEAQYGYAAFCIGMKKDEEAEEILSLAVKNVEILLQKEAYVSKAYAIYSGLHAFKLHYEPYKSFYYGPRIVNYIDKAVKKDSTNPVAWSEKGNMKYHAPKMFGGDKKEAIQYYLKSIKLYEQKSGMPECNWMYLNTLTWLAQSYEKTGQPNSAAETYKKILQLAPDYQWVHDELYPRFLKNNPKFKTQ